MPTKSLERLILEFNKLPGVGQKSATRYAFHILNQSEEDVKNFAEALLAVKLVIYVLIIQEIII